MIYFSKFDYKVNYFKFSFLALLILLVNCYSKKESVFGEYKSAKFDKLYSYCLRINHTSVITGTSLILASDSTFHQINCGNLMSGIYKVVNDSLYLICKKNRYKNDSINLIKKLDCYSKPMVFSIYRNKLRASIKLLDRKEKVIIYLEKIKTK